MIEDLQREIQQLQERLLRFEQREIEDHRTVEDGMATIPFIRGVRTKTHLGVRTRSCDIE